jgi:uncharacterized protein YggT (Ycf19 family)
MLMDDNTGLNPQSQSSTVYTSPEVVTPSQPPVPQPQQYYQTPQQPMASQPQSTISPSTNIVVQPMANPGPTTTVSAPQSHPRPNSSNLGDTMATLGDKMEQVIMLVYFFIAAILLFRFVFSLFGANRQTPFSGFVYQITSPFMIPFQNLFGFQAGVGQYLLEFEVVIALVVYGLAFFGAARLIKILFK